MVTEGQRIIVLKEKRLLDTWSGSFFIKKSEAAEF